jgi:predicted enzyme related to lactoylglutathione lyase
MNLSAVRIFVRDIAEARRFYQEKLGFNLEQDDIEHGVCVFSSGSTRIIVEAVADDAPDDEQILVGRFTGLSFAVDNIQVSYKQLLSIGVKFSGQPEQQYWGGWLATLKDPAGNELQLVQTDQAAPVPRG